MSNPPSHIDGARVLWWAWAGDQPFGVCSDISIFGFAICQYDSGSLYRFSCDQNWQTVNDSPQNNVEQAKATIPQNYLAYANRIHWQAATI